MGVLAVCFINAFHFDVNGHLNSPLVMRECAITILVDVRDQGQEGSPTEFVGVLLRQLIYVQPLRSSTKVKKWGQVHLHAKK